MARIFLVLATMAMMLGLSACNRASVAEIRLPEEVAATSDPFLAAVKRGDAATAQKFVAPTFADDSRIDLPAATALLQKSPALVPAVYTPKPQLLGNDENEVILIYAAKDGDRWVSSELRMYRPEGGAFEIEYWDVRSSAEMPNALETQRNFAWFMQWMMIGMGALALLALAIIIWVVKDRPHIVAPEPVIDERNVASTSRNEE